jgi:hypothetical protein
MTIIETAPDRLSLLRRIRSVAIVGASANPSRASNFVATYLLGATDWTVWFVSPRETEILGHKVYPALADLPVVPDVVDVFRKAEDLPGATADAVDVGAPVLWFQLGLIHEEAADAASRAGLDVVQNRCLKIEHARFAGGLHMAGFNTGVIDSRRTRLV